MALHPVLQEKLNIALERPAAAATRRDAVLPTVPNKAHAVSYVKTAEGFEVDFLARFPDGKEELIQVCADPTQPETLNRELRALSEAQKEHPKAQQRLLVSTFAVLPKDAPAQTIAQTAWTWLLEDQMGVRAKPTRPRARGNRKKYT